MGADQQFCLRWNNFHSNITSAFESLRDDEDFVDITLACDGRQIKAHKMVLSACSPYFRSLLKGNPCQHPIVFLKDVTFSNLSSILDFMYHGEVNVSHNELATFLKTAEALKVRGLAEDEKKKDSENYNESSSPPPPRDPPDPGSPRPEEGSSAPDTHLSDSPPPKRQRRRSGNSVHSTEDTNETVLSDQQVRDTSVKNEPQDFNEEEDILSQSVDQDIIKSDVVDDDRNFGPAESVTIRSQAAMQQLQESFGSFLPGMGQSPGFLPHGATDMPRPPPYPLEGVQGLPPGISALPGPSMSQGAASQDASQGKPSILYTPVECPRCKRRFFNKYSAKRHMIQAHGENRFHTRPYARADPSCTSTFSADLQAMGVGYSSAGASVNDVHRHQSVAKSRSSFVQEGGASDPPPLPPPPPPPPLPPAPAPAPLPIWCSQVVTVAKTSVDLVTMFRSTNNNNNSTSAASTDPVLPPSLPAAAAVCLGGGVAPAPAPAAHQPLLHNLLNNVTVPSPSSSSSSSSSSSASPSQPLALAPGALNRSGHLGHESSSSSSAGGPPLPPPPLAPPHHLSVGSLRKASGSHDTAVSSATSASLAPTFSSSQNL